MTKASIFYGKEGALIFSSKADGSEDLSRAFFACINNILYSIYRVC